jgi:membrane protein DedA with SNARE-associated domain
MSDLESFVQSYGYGALFLGTLLEGETVLILGMDRTIRIRRFILLNLIGAALWSAVVAAAGYFFGRVVKILLADIRHYELALLPVVLLTGIAIRLLAVYREKRRESGKARLSS